MPNNCKGWPPPCGTPLTPETEKIFGEAVLCAECYGRAYSDFADALADQYITVYTVNSCPDCGGIAHGGKCDPKEDEDDP